MLSLRTLDELDAASISLARSVEASVILRRLVEYAFVTEDGTQLRFRTGVSHTSRDV